MKKSTYNKLVKTLELIEKAKALLEQVEKENEEIRYSSNSNFRWTDLNRAASITKGQVDEYAKNWRYPK
jgi:hypothetical protein